MNDNQYDESKITMKPPIEKTNNVSIQPAINASSRRAIAKKRVDYDDYLDSNSGSRTKRRNKINGKKVLIF